MRRPIVTAIAVLVGFGLLLPLAACRSQAGTTPTVASVDFTPKATIAVEDGGQLTVTPAASSADPGTLPAGSVVIIANDSSGDQRVTGTLDGKASIDTGILNAGQQVTVVLATAGELELWPNARANGQSVKITVTPRPR